MTRAIRVHALGGPEVLRWETVEPGEPGRGEALVRHAAIGVNYIDVYHRTGLYPTPLPFVPGLEAAGTVEAVGPGVDALAPGDRVVYASRPLGAYAQARLVPADRLVRLPAELSFEQGAAAFLKGLTAQVLVRRVFRVERGQTILVHAAAGGVGTLLCQWAHALGARVLGTVGSAQKAEHARAHGCDEPILYREEDVARRVRELTDGAGVPVVYDSVGRDSLAASLDALAPLGTLVSFGQSSGAPPALELAELGRRGSLTVTRPSLLDYTARREDLLGSARELFEVLASGALRVSVGNRWPLERAADAHRALESRATVGASLLVP